MPKADEVLDECDRQRVLIRNLPHDGCYKTGCILHLTAAARCCSLLQVQG
jgi:hypothetical protein